MVIQVAGAKISWPGGDHMRLRLAGTPLVGDPGSAGMRAAALRSHWLGSLAGLELQVLRGGGRGGLPYAVFSQSL
ncbi:MAG: hypothetical protein WBN94_13235 [Methanothrix sp.]